MDPIHRRIRTLGLWTTNSARCRPHLTRRRPANGNQTANVAASAPRRLVTTSPRRLPRRGGTRSGTVLSVGRGARPAASMQGSFAPRNPGVFAPDTVPKAAHGHRTTKFTTFGQNGRACSTPA